MGMGNGICAPKFSFHRHQRRALNPLELESQVVVSHLVWVLGAQLVHQSSKHAELLSTSILTQPLPSHLSACLQLALPLPEFFSSPTQLWGFCTKRLLHMGGCCSIPSCTKELCLLSFAFLYPSSRYVHHAAWRQSCLAPR